MSNPSLKAADYDLQDPEQFRKFMNARLEDAIDVVQSEFNGSGVPGGLAALTGIVVAHTVMHELELQKLQAQINECRV